MSISLERKGLLKDGNYRARVKEAEVRQGANHPYIAVILELLDNNGRPTDRQLWDNVSLAPKAAFMLDQFLDSLALDTEGSQSYKAFCRNIQGKQLHISVGKKLYQGQYRNDVLNYLTSAQVESMTLSEVPEYVPSLASDDDDEDSSEPRAFSPSSPLDTGEEGEDESSSVLDDVTEGETEDVAF